MEERDDLEQMAFIQKWNDGKAEREKKREQMWNGILEKAGIKKEEKLLTIQFQKEQERSLLESEFLPTDSWRRSGRSNPSIY